MPLFEPQSIHRDNDLARAGLLLPDSFTPMVDWMGPSKDWPGGEPGSSNPV